MKVYGPRGRRFGWLGLGALVPLVVGGGCASGPTEQEMALAQKDQEIQMLNTLLNEEKGKVIELEQATEVAETKVAAQDETIDALKDGLAAREGLLRQKEDQIRTTTDLASTYRGMAEEAKRSAKSMAASAPSGSSREGAAPKEAVASQSGKGRYHLRVIALPKNEPSEESAREIAAHLEKQSITDVAPRTSGNHWVVDVGNFASMKTAEAVELQSRVQTMKFQGVAQFKDAYFVTY